MVVPCKSVMQKMLLSNFYGGKYIKYEQFGSKL